MITAAAAKALNEIATTFGTTGILMSEVNTVMPHNAGHLGRRGTQIGRGVYSIENLVTETVKRENAVVSIEQTETDEEIGARLDERFEALSVMTHATAVGINRALIVSGAPGLGKSYGIEKKLEQLETMGATNATFVKGYVRPMAMYKLMYENRTSDSVIIFDDADSVFGDDVALNLLKAACDSSKTRRISWMSQSKMETEDGDEIPKTFDFEGNIIFITNLDFDGMIKKGNKLAPHFEALISRALYLDLGLKTNRDYYVRVQQVIEKSNMLESFTADERHDLMNYIDKNKNRFRDFSLRMVLKLGAIYRMGKSWESYANMTLLK